MTIMNKTFFHSKAFRGLLLVLYVYSFTQIDASESVSEAVSHSTAAQHGPVVIFEEVAE